MDTGEMALASSCRTDKSMIRTLSFEMRLLSLYIYTRLIYEIKETIYT